jgi:hypothetical protein
MSFAQMSLRANVTKPIILTFNDTGSSLIGLLVEIFSAESIILDATANDLRAIGKLFSLLLTFRAT